MAVSAGSSRRGARGFGEFRCGFAVAPATPPASQPLQRTGRASRSSSFERWSVPARPLNVAPLSVCICVQPPLIPRRIPPDTRCSMRALSIRQPYAELIPSASSGQALRGIKTVELRSR